MEIQFKRDTAFRKQFFVPDSFSHPAKMDAQLLIWIVSKYTASGEVILDPMAGSGTTMLACMLGRDVVLVELEEKFCKMMRDNWEIVKMHPQLGYSMGICQIIQGDARQLEGLLVDKIVTSPPYAEVKQDDTHKPEGYWDKAGKIGHKPDMTPSNKENIGNLPYGEIDKCIFSPPYAESKEIHDIEFLKNTAGDMSESVKAGKTKGHFFTKEARERAMAKKEQGLTDNPENISNLPYGQIDKIVTSPPHEDIAGASRHGEKIRLGKCKIVQEKHLPRPYTTEQTKDNIGNLKSQSYLEAMLLVYAQCFAALKPQGLMILVTKNFIRNKQVVRLDKDTIKLCEQAGFQFLERHYRKLPSQSFWRVIYYQKHPEVEQIKYEDVLVFRKSA